MTTIPAAASLPRLSRLRRVLFVVLAALLAVLTGVLMGGVPALLGAFTADGAEVIHQVHYLHWGAFMGVLTAVPLAASVRRPTLAAAQQVAIVVAGFVIAVGAARMFDPAVVVFPVLIGLLLALHPARDGLLRRGEGFSRPLGMFAATVTVPAVWYAASEIGVHLAAPLTDPHRGPPEAHYVTGAALALAIVGLAWLAALRTEGWRLPAWCTGLAMAMTGAVSVWLPGWVSSFGRVWGVTALLWGVAFIITAEVTARAREPR